MIGRGLRSGLPPALLRPQPHPSPAARGLSTIPPGLGGYPKPHAPHLQLPGTTATAIISQNRSCFPETDKLAQSDWGGAAKEKAFIGCYSGNQRG